MSYIQSWAEALNIKPEKLSAWSAQAPAGMPLLVWCLEKGHVPTADYLEWASQTYGLPILKSEFFSQAFDFHSLTESRNTWDPWCFPVDHWDDVTIVACVEPPHERPEGTFVFVLAEPVAMLEAWSRNAADTTIKAVPRHEPDQPPPQVDAPIGVDMSATNTFQLNLDGISLKHESSEDVDPHLLEKISPQENSAQTLSVIRESVEPPPIKAPVSAPPPVPPPAPKVEKKPAPKTELKLEKPQAKPPTPAANPPKSEDREIDRAFTALSETYEGVVLFKCEGTEAVPNKWKSSLNLSAEGQRPVSLTTPSLFRIVAKTQLPYHGYVVDSPTHRAFFSSLGLGDLPEAVIAVPLVHDNRLLGIIMAYGDESLKDPQHLETVQRAAEFLTEAMQNSLVKKAA